jgi:predicted DNA binding protein
MCNKNRYIIKGTDERVKDFFKSVRIQGLVKDIEIKKLEDNECDIISDLTSTQKKILNLAKKFGYYDYPRKITSEELSEKTGINKDEILESLRKAEKKIITRILEDNFI